MPRYALVTLLDDVHVGADFAASAWPLHLTLVSNFAIAWDARTLGERLRPVLDGRRPIALVASHERLFGPQGTVPVNVVESAPELMSLHQALHDMLAANGGVFDRPAYVADGYRPHVTVQRHRRLQCGDKFRVDAVSIVDLAPDGAPDRRKILRVLALPTRDNATEPQR
jgi:hypothetical protein